MVDSSQAAKSQVLLPFLVCALPIFPSAKANIEDGENGESCNRQGFQDQDAEFSHKLMIDAMSTDFVLKTISNHDTFRIKT